MMNVLSLTDFFRSSARITGVKGSIITAPLRHSFIGEQCHLYPCLQGSEVIASAETIAFDHRGAVLCLLGETSGISTSDIVVPQGSTFSVALSPALLGTVINAQGEVRQYINKDRPVEKMTGSQSWSINRTPPDIDQRAPVRDIFVTGIRAIDGLLSCGIGQRTGIFAAAGAGKTTLMSMILKYSQADVYVIGLVGERGREVTEFLLTGIPQEKRDKTIVVYSTSDSPAVERRNAALLATTIAEYFRDAGHHVVLMIDSMTRYARALRDVALSAGEVPARRGFPASVFDDLPRILERSGNTQHGCITAFYTVLLEEEDDVDPIGDEIRSIIDGHICLSRKLADKGHYPAIDVLRSVSRLATAVADSETLRAAASVREALARLEELQLMIELGEYQAGENAATDVVIGKKEKIMAFLRQSEQYGSSLHETKDMLRAIQ